MIRRTVWIVFAALCLVAGTSWGLPNESSLPALQRQGLLFGLSGLAALCLPRPRTALSARLQIAVAGTGFFGFPIVVVEIVRGSVGEITRSVLFALVSIVIVLVIAITDTTSNARRLLLPALVGIGGLLLLLPLQFSTTSRGLLMLAFIAGAIIVVGICSVWLYRLLHGIHLADAIAVIGIANAAFLLLCAATRGELAWKGSQLASAASLSSLIDVAEIILIVWLLREIPPARFAARYLLIPLVTILESYVLLRPEATLRMVSGAVLLAAGAGMLLLLDDRDHDAALSLR